jgi:hypothetical protein
LSAALAEVVVFFFSTEARRSVLLARALLASLLIVRIASRRLTAYVLTKIIVLACATHVPIEVVVRHSVMCHLSSIPPSVRYFDDQELINMRAKGGNKDNASMPALVKFEKRYNAQMK